MTISQFYEPITMIINIDPLFSTRKEGPMINFSASKISRRFLFGFMAISLATTSLSTALTTTAYAATVDNTQQVNHNSKANYGLIALGLLAVLMSHSHNSDNVATKPSTAGTTVSNSNTSPASTISNSASPASTVSNSASPASTVINSASPASTTTGVTNAVAAEQQAVSLLNADRRANGLPDLQVDSRLTTLAQNYAQDMINRNYFSHTNPEGQTPFDRMTQAGISYSYAGENIAQAQNVQAAEVAFMNDAGHRANILSPNYTAVGIGVAYDNNGNIDVVQDFIKP